MVTGVGEKRDGKRFLKLCVVRPVFSPPPGYHVSIEPVLLHTCFSCKYLDFLLSCLHKFQSAIKFYELF